MAIVNREPKGTVYVNRENERITKQKWLSLRANRAYSLLRHYRNREAKIELILTWLGEVPDADQKQEHLWEIFRLSYLTLRGPDDLDFEGVPYFEEKFVVDQDLCAEFTTEHDALCAYEDILMRHAGCEMMPSVAGIGNSASDSSYYFIEKGNELTPVVQSADLPSASASNDSIGSW